MGTNDINLIQTIETKTTSPITEPVDPIGSAAPGAGSDSSSVRPDSQAAAIAGAAAAASGSGGSSEIILKPINKIM